MTDYRLKDIADDVSSDVEGGGSISIQRAEWCGTAHRAARQLHAHCAAVGACERGPEQRCAPCPDCARCGQGEDGSR